MRVLYIALETHLQLKRNKIFLPMMLVFVVIAFVAVLVSDLALQDFRHVLLDICLAGLHVAGGLAAIFWGTKSMIDSRQEGSLEVQLASPASRSEWLLGKYLGLAMTLIVLGLIFVGIGQAAMHFLGLGWLSGDELVSLSGIVFIWLILAACAVFFASFCNIAVAVFSCLCLWAIGGMARFLADGIAGDAGLGVRSLAAKFLDLWDLQRFNLSDLLQTPAFPTAPELWWRGIYGALLLSFILGSTCLVFSQRDVGR